MHFANCAAFDAVWFTIYLSANIYSKVENLSLSSSTEAEIALNLFLNFEQK